MLRTAFGSLNPLVIPDRRQALANQSERSTRLKLAHALEDDEVRT